jgi:serine/threonine protein kinase
VSDLIGRKIGPYEIRSQLGKGGMSVVYLAHQASLNRLVAIKVLTGWLAQDTQFVQRFRQEALAAGGLRHPNILRILDAGTFEGQHYIVMDYVSGDTLADMIRKGPVPPELAAELAAQIADALDYAHRRGIIHRDLKPSNVLMDDDGRPLLADFGIAQAVGSGPRLTQTGAMVGTPEYMSPEQSEGLRVDGRSDIFSLGIVLYQMLTGRVPFTATTPAATLYQVVHKLPPPPRQLNPNIPSYLESIILRALAKQPEQRFANAREMAQALRERRIVAGPDAETQLISVPAVSKAAAAGPQNAVLSGRKHPSGGNTPLRIVAALISIMIIALVGWGIYTLLSPGARTASSHEALAPISSPSPTVAGTPTPAPSTPTPVVVVVEKEKVVTATPAPTPTAVPPTQTPWLIVATPTSTPTSTPTPSSVPTTTPVPPTATTRPTTTPPSPATRQPNTRSNPATVLDFEEFGVWKRGNEPYGTFVQAADRKHTGNYSGKLTYAIPDVANHYVVFMRRPPAPIPGQPAALNVWVYGDGSNHFLNAWIQDNQGEVRQFTFGQVSHTDAWQQMTLQLDPTASWPQGHISGVDNNRLDYPIRLYALVLDVAPRSGAATYSGAIYIDDLVVGEGALSQPTAASGGAPRPATAPVTSSPTGRLAGHIVFTAASGGTTEIRVLDVANKAISLLFPNARQPDIRSDQRVVLDGIGGGKNNIFSINLDGSGEIMNGRHPEDSYPSWSPTGQSAVFYSTIGGGREQIYIQWDMSHSEEPKALATGDTIVFGSWPVWLENWRIAFSGCNYWDSGSLCGIWTTDSNGSGQAARLTERSDDRATDSARGTVLYASQATGNWDVYAISANGGAARNLTNNPNQDTGATFSPDGSLIAFMSNRDGNWAIWVMNADGNSPRKLIDVPDGFGAGWAEERLAWGP